MSSIDPFVLRANNTFERDARIAENAARPIAYSSSSRYERDREFNKWFSSPDRKPGDKYPGEFAFDQPAQETFGDINRAFSSYSSSASNYVFSSSGGFGKPPDVPFTEPQFMGDDDDDPSDYASPIVPSASLWTQGSVPRPFDLPLRDRRVFSAVTNAYVARANDFFHRQGIDVTTPTASETGYKPAMASWGSTQTPRGAPLSTTAFRVGTWGYHTSNPLPTFGGNIITPVLQIDDSSGIWQAKTLQPHEVIGRALVEGRGAAQRHINKYYDPKMDSKAFESLVQRGERVGASAVRSGTGMFATATWAERYTATPGYTAAMQSSYQLENIGKYGILPRDLFNIIGQHGYFTRKPYASKDIENPERSTWSMYHISSLGSSGWLYNPNIGEHGTFRTDVSLDKIPKRRQLMVQTAAVPEVNERLFNRIRRSRLSQDRSGAKAMYANTLFVDNYPLSEGTAAIHPDAAPIGFRKMQHQFVERPRDAKAWSVDWNLQKSTQPGQALFLGTQLVNGREMPLQTIKGIRGVRQELWGVREIDEKGRQGFELAIGEHHPAESGGFKIFHSGVKALMMKSRSIVEGFRRSTGREFDVVAPLPKSWQLLQYGMIDYLPQKDLLGLLDEGGMDREEANRLIMGVRSNPKEQYQYLGPLQDALTKAIRGRRFEFEHTLQMDKRNIEAFRMAGSLVGEKDLGGDRVAATVKMTGYNLPMPLQYRQEFPGKKPFYSPEELKRLGARLQNVPSHMRDQAELELIRLRKGNAASRIFGAAQATEKGYDPRRSMKYEEMDWIDIGAKAINIPGSDDEPLLQAIEAQMRERKALYITGPGGIVFPRPSDVKRMGALNLQGREMSTFVTSYVRAVTGLGDVAGDVPVRVAEFGEQLAKMGSYSNVRRHAMGKAMERSVEGPYVGHVGIPDEYMVAGDDALMRLGGLRSREQLAGFKQEIEEQGFYAALSRRPQSSPTMQFETMLRVVSPEYAKRKWDVDIEDLGRNFALSTTTAGVQRGDFDADRAIARALTRKTRSGELFTPDYYDFKKNDQRRQILTALRQQAPQDYAAYRATLTPEQTAQLDSALAGNLKDSMAIVRATYGIGYVTKPTDAKWNELAKWTESLQVNKLHPDNPANSTDFWKSVKGPLLVEEMYTYTGAQVIDAFRRKHVEPKSQMGPVYNQYIRGLAALAVGPVEQAAAEAFGAITYQDTIDMEPMKQSVATLLDMTYYLGKSGSMHRHYSTPLEGEGNFKQITTNSGAVLGALLEQFKRLPVSRDMQAVLFSRDPQIQAWYKQGNFAQITREISRRGAGNYMVDPNQAGPLVQLVRSQQLAKSSWSGMQKTVMEEAAMRTGEGLGAYRGIYSKTAIKAGDITDKLRTMVDKPEEAKFMRSMMAMRSGASRLYYSSKEEVVDDLMNLPSFANPALPGKEFPALISKKEADVLEGLRQMPPGQAQEIAAVVSRPARHTPAGGVQSFSTGTGGWDKTINRLSEFALRGAFGFLNHAPDALLRLGIGSAGKLIERLLPNNARAMAAGQLGHYLLGGGATRNLVLPEEVANAEARFIGKTMYGLGRGRSELTSEFIHENRGSAPERMSTGTPQEVGWENALWTVGQRDFHPVVGGYYAKYQQGSDTILARDWYDWHMPQDGSRWLTQTISLPSRLENLAWRGFQSMSRRGIEPRLTARHGQVSLNAGVVRGVSFNVSDQFFSTLGTPFLSQWTLPAQPMLEKAAAYNIKTVPSFTNPALPGEEFPAYISKKEAAVLEGLRQMPVSNAQQIAAAVSRPPRYTPKGGVPGFDTGPVGWDKLSPTQQDVITKMRQEGALPKRVTARIQEMLAQVQTSANIPMQAISPFADENTYPEYWQDAGLSTQQKQKAYANQMQTVGKVSIPAAAIESVLPALPWKEGHRVKAETHNQGRSWLFTSIPDKNAWRYANRAILTQAFERAVTKDFRETDDQEVYMGSQGAVYGDWTAVANRPSEQQIGQMPLARQITTRQGIVKATLGAAQKMGLSNTEFAEQMPESYKLMERQVEALNQSREATHDLVQTMEKMRDAVGKNTEIQGKLAEVFQPGSAGFKQAQTVLQGALQTQAAGKPLSPEQINQLSSASRVFAYTGRSVAFGAAYNLLQGETAKAVEAEELGIMQTGKGGRKGFTGALQKVFGADGTGGPAGGLFEDVAFGWTAFRLRMVMGLTTGAQGNWRNQFYGEQGAMANAALLLGATPAQGGSLSQYITARNQIANMRANLGYGSAQVVGGFSSAIAGLGLGAGVGSAATIAGYGAAATMGTGIVAASLSKVFPSLAAGPIGVGAGLTTAGVLGMSYISGQAPEYLRYDTGTYPNEWRRSARIGQLYAQEVGAPKLFQTLAAGASVLTPSAGFESIIFNTPAGKRVSEQLAAEQAQWNQPNYLPRVMTELEEFVGTKWPTAEKGPAADLLSRIAQMTGIQADSLTKRGGDKTVAITDKLMDYVVAGADVGSIYSSMMGAVNLAGVPLGAPGTDWMLNYLDTVPKEQRAIYEQYLGALGPYRQATGRPLDIGMVSQIRSIAETRGVTPEQASQRFMMQRGYGGAAQQYGLMAGSPQAIAMGWSEDRGSPEEVEQQNAWRSQLAQTFRSGGSDIWNTEGAVRGLRQRAPEQLIEVQELSVIARNVVIQTGRDTAAGLVDTWTSLGFQNMSPAQRQAQGTRWGGIAGLAPTTMVQGGTQAAEFERGLNRQSDLVAYQTAAAQILQQTRPGGYSEGQLDLVAGRLYRGESINTVSSDLLATSGRMGIGAGMGFGTGTGASAAIDVQARSTAQFLGGQGTVSERASYLASFVANPQYLTGSRAAAALAPGSPAAIAYQKVSSGQWSPYQGGLMAQLSDRINPLGYTANLAFEQGTFSEFLAGGVPAGGLQDIYGRQPGAEAMFGAQQAAGWSSYRLGMAQEQVRQARFGRQVNEWRQEWGSGAYTPTSQVMQAIGGGAEIGSGMQVGGSTIGLVQQEAAIRRQMWQENLNYQRQSFAFAQQQLQLQKEQLALSRQEYSIKRQYQLGEREAGRGMQLLQRQWTQQDWAIQGERVGITNQWAQEDIARAIRYSTGRERVQLMRQRERMTIQQGWESEDRSRNQDRQRQQWRYEDERYEKAIQNEQALHDIQMQRFSLQERSLELQGAQLAAQMAHAEKMASFEAELRKIEDERFKINYENMQKQIEEELKLEPIRQEAIAADLAYQATRLSNAQLIWDAEKKYMEWLKQMIIDVTAEWVKLRSAQAGQSSPSTVANQCSTCGQTFATPAELQAHLTATGHGNMRTSSGIGVSSDQALMSYSGPANSSQPVTVNFILDGEVIMSTVVTPERLRPVVQEVDQRNRRR